MPLLRFSQEANLTESYVNMVQLVLILPSLGTVTFFGIAGIGVFIFFIGIFIFIREKWRHGDNQELLSGEENDDTGRVGAW